MFTNLILIYEGGGWGIFFHCFVNALKAMLDLLGSTWVLIAEPGSSMRGFRKGKIDGTVLSGGKLANWFRHSCPNGFLKGCEAADTIEQNSIAWISELVEYRDTLNHRGEISGLTPLAVRLELNEGSGKPRGVYTKDDVLFPHLPNGQDLRKYCRQTLHNAECFLLAMCKLFASKESRSFGIPESGDRIYISEDLLDGVSSGDIIHNYE